CLVPQPISDSEARAKVSFMQLASGPRKTILAEIIELLRLKIEYGSLIIDLRGGKVQGVANTGSDRQSAGCLPGVLNEVLLDVGAGADRLLLKVDRKGLHLAQKEAGERIARAGRSRQIGKQTAELEEPRRRRRLNDVQSFPAEIQSGFDRVFSVLERQ